MLIESPFGRVDRGSGAFTRSMRAASKYGYSFLPHHRPMRGSFQGRSYNFLMNEERCTIELELQRVPNPSWVSSRSEEIWIRAFTPYLEAALRTGAQHESVGQELAEGFRVELLDRVLQNVPCCMESLENLLHEVTRGSQTIYRAGFLNGSL